MKRHKVLWGTVLAVSAALLLIYGVYAFSLFGFRWQSSSRMGSDYDNGMRGWFNDSRIQVESGERLSVDQIKTGVENYLKSYSEELHIADVFVYSNSDYYVSVEEESTGKGAMELLVDPLSGRIYPEHGPNMMWNEKYGMHGSSGMMGLYRDDSSSGKVDKESAIKLGDSYVKSQLGEDYSVTGEGHEFYGYYTFHIEKGGSTVGMLSVNQYSGEVWYHDWHGELLEVISGH